MTKGLAICGTVAVALLLAPAGIEAHHPIATQFDSAQEKTLQGTVEQFNWRSPHSELVLSVREDGETARWTIQLDSPDTLDGLGWSRETVGQGDRVTVVAWPARDGSKQAVAKSITLDDGRELAALNPHDPAYAPASAARPQGDVAADRQRDSSAQDRDGRDHAAQHAERADTQADASAQASAARSGEEVHLVGCIELERDYRARTDGSRGGLLGTGVGAANEFVLVNATPGPPEGAAAADREVGTSGERAEPQADRQSADDQDRSQAERQGEPQAVGASGEETKVFSLTGDQESTLARAVGRQVHVVGTVEESGRDGGMPRVNISVWHPVQDYCPAP